MAATTTPLPVSPKGHLLRILGVGFGIAVIIGGTIGSGILRTPGLVADRVRSPGIIIAVWLVGGIYALCCALSVAELGTMLPCAGGWYVYARRAFGDYGDFWWGASIGSRKPSRPHTLRLRLGSSPLSFIRICRVTSRSYRLRA